MANDGTSRQKRQYNVTQVGTNDGLLTMGLQEMVGEDAATVLECNKSVLNEAADLLAKLRNTDKEQEFKKLVTSCDNTMSDRGAVMRAFNHEYEEWRATLLSATEGFSNLSPDEQASLLKVDNFYCFMHVHINQATYSEDSLKLLDESALEVHKEGLPGNYRPTSSSSTSAAIHAAAKAFERHGDEQAGQTADFEAHVRSKKKKIMFKRNVGNRAQILFENGAAYVYHMEDMRVFLKMRKGEAALNNLLQAVECHLANKVATAGAHALGILYYAVSKPMWLVQEKSTHVFDLNPRAQQMQQKFDDWSKDAAPLLEKRAQLFDDIPIMPDEMTQSVYMMEDSETEELVVKALELICQNWQILVQRMLEERLEGGKYSDPSEELKEKTRNVPTTNKGCERTFAVQDSIMHMKPNSKLLHQESLVMTKQNKTCQYLHTSDPAKRDEMWHLATKEAPKCHEENKLKQITLTAQRQKKIKQMALRADIKDLKQRTEKSQLLSTVVSWGGEWKSADEVDEALAAITGNKKGAVVAQLKLQKNILGSKVPRDKQYLFQQQGKVKGKTHVFTLDELVAHLKEIIKLNPHLDEIYKDTDDVRITHIYTVIPADKRKELFTQQKQALAEKLQEETAKRNQPASTARPRRVATALPSDPNFLVGQRVEHKFDIVEKDAGKKKLKKNVWFSGTVQRIVQEADNIFETLYEVRHDMINNDSSDCESDEETKDTFQYELLLDYVEGSLKIVP